MTLKPLAAAVLLVLTASAAPLAQSRDELAQRRFDSGLDFLRQGKFKEALNDFRAVVESYPTSTIADDALLEVARYQLETARDFDAAQAAVDALGKSYADGDASPFGLVMAGRITLARGRSPEHLSSALSNFERVPRLHPGTDAVPAALLARADTLRIAGRCGEAVEQYRDLIAQYPRSAWAPEAHVGASRCLVAGGRPVDAMQSLQRAVDSPNAGAAAATARALNTILFRLHLRDPRPPYVPGAVLGGTTGKVKDLRGLAVKGDEVYLLGETGMTVQLRGKGGLQRQTSVVQGRGLFLDGDGTVVVVGRNGLQREGGRFTPVAVPKPDKTMKPLESITAAGMLSTGETLIADEDGRLVYLFNRELKLLANFATVRTDRLIVGSTDQIAMLDGGEKAVNVYSRDGRVVSRISQRGSGWSLDEPVDLAFDAFDHLYVLDRGLKAVLVFALGQTPRLIKTFTLPDDAAGAFRRATTLAVDRAGRLYIHDNRAERVQVYQ